MTDPTPPSPEALAREIVQKWDSCGEEGNAYDRDVLRSLIAQALAAKEDECQRLREERGREWKRGMAEKISSAYEKDNADLKARLSDAVGLLAQAEKEIERLSKDETHGR